MRKRIIISTSWGSLNFLREGREKKKLILIKTNKFIGYDHTTNEFVVNKSDTDIILIQDGAEKDDLTQVLTFKEESYFLHHRNANKLSDVQGVLFAQIAVGMHESTVADKYKPVFDIILDNESNKLNRILKVLDFTDEKIEEKNILEAKLTFLHHLLIPFNVALQTIDSKWNADTEFETIKKIAKTENVLSETYVNSLAILRDKLLSSS